MSKEKIIFPKQEDTRLLSRIRKRFHTLFSSGGVVASSDRLPNRWRASAIAVMAGSVFGFCLLVNFTPGGWLTFIQMALLSLGVGLVAALWTFMYITNAQRLLKRGFFAGAFITLLAIIGYSWSFKLSGQVPMEVAVGAAPMEGLSILGAVSIVILLFLGMLHESKST